MCTLVQKQLRDSHKDISRNLADKSRKIYACTCEFDLHASHARQGVTRASHESNSGEPIIMEDDFLYNSKLKPFSSLRSTIVRKK